MASPRTPRRRPARLVAPALVVLLGFATVACSSSGDDAADGTTSTTVSSGTTGTTGGTPGSSTSSPSTSTSPTTADEPDISPPSSLPSFDGTCATLAETYGLDAIQPKNTGSWVDERQRIVVDAQREAALLGQAQEGAPADVAAHLATMEAYASFLATAVGGADGFTAAVSAVEAYPDQVGVSLAIASVDTWQRANCPR